MKQIATWLLTVFWLAAVFSEVPFLENAAQADELSPRQNEIIRTTMAADGWLTEDMHQEFWAQVPPSVRSNPETIKFLTQAIGEGINFHRETWESVMMSLQAGRVIESPGYEAAKANIFASPTAELLREQNAAGINSAERLISAAANKSPLVTPKGTLYITDELVAQTIAGLDASICRMKQLVNPSWAPKIEETRYADVYVRILSDCPFRREYQDIAVESGRKSRMAMLLYTISMKDQLAVEFIPIGGQFAVPQQSVVHLAQSALNAMGIVDAKPGISEWRGHMSAEAFGSVVSSQGIVYASVRVVNAPEHQGAWAFLAVTSDSLIDAQAQRNSLEASAQLDIQ